MSVVSLNKKVIKSYEYNIVQDKADILSSNNKNTIYSNAVEPVKNNGGLFNE